MAHTHRFRLMACTLLYSGTIACASGPEKPDPRAASDATATDAERSGDGTIPFDGAEMTRPVQIGGPTPSLPPRAIEKRVMGTWIARCIITETGSVEGCKIVQGLEGANAHILQTVHQMKFRPVIYEGVPQRVFYTFKITFK